MNRRWGLQTILSLAVAAITSFVASPAALAQGRAGAIAGTVGSEAGIVEGATVKLMQGDSEIASTSSNSDGRFGFRQVPQGRYTVVAFKEGVGRGRTNAGVRAGETTAVRVRLVSPERQPGAIRAHVGNATDGPIAGAYVVLLSQGQPIARTLSNDRGVAEFGRLRPGDYTIVASKDGFREGRSAVTVVSGQVIDTRVIIERAPAPGAILGGVFFNDAPVADAEVTLVAGGRVIAVVRSGRDGIFNFPNLRPGTYTVNAAKRGVGRGTTEVTVTSGNSSRARVILNP